MNRMAASAPLLSLEALEQRRAQARQRTEAERGVIRVCCGPGCIPKGARRVHERFSEVIGKAGAKNLVVSNKATGCQGLCEAGPIVTVDPAGYFYVRVRPEDAEEIFENTIRDGKVVERLLYRDGEDAVPLQTAQKAPFYRGNVRVALELCGVVDPTSTDDYLVRGGFSALAKALRRMTPEQVIEEITKSGLRGKGGGGFLTGRKWQSARQAHGEPKYVIANGDEGDPGAFMDRALMEGVPHAVIEGMIIAAYAIGATKGYIYVRNEYPLAVERLHGAILQARELGLLGKTILGSGLDFDIRICRGAGAFVCGESTALMASLEGRIGEPRAKYIHTVESGVWGKPSCLNNVETLATVPPIILKGAAWHAGLGTARSKGTKAFSLVGKVKNTGIIEVPMGMTLRQIIFDIGGGMRGDRPFKAVQTGGPSGGCIPAQFLDTPVDFDELTKLGSMMGSGGMIVMDEDDCMVHVAHYFLRFLKEESCGKCTPCREGIIQMLHILERITRGEGQPEHLELLRELAVLLEGASLCALGKTAANPVLSTIRYFQAEYEEHIRRRHCPAKVCRALFRFEIPPDLCNGCGMCARNCPVQCITGERKKPHHIDQERCTKCGVCFEKCPTEAVTKI